MNERIKHLRRTLHLRQSDFGEKIGISRDTVANIEGARAEVKEIYIISICREFGVSEEWLRLGIGEMFSERSNILKNYLEQIESGNDAFIKEIVIAYMELSPTDKIALRKFIDSLYSGSEKNNVPLNERPFEELTIDEKVELYRQQLVQEEELNKKERKEAL